METIKTSYKEQFEPNCPHGYKHECKNCNLLNNAECELGVEHLENKKKWDIEQANKDYGGNGQGNFYDDLMQENKNL